MTITSITKLPSGKTGATITSNLDELAIIRGLVVNALRHMPDVGETTSTRQRLKAMSRVLHKVYGSVASSTSWPVITKPSPGPDVTLSRILNSMPEEFYTADFITKAELAGCTKEVSIMYLQSLVGDNLLTMSPDTLMFNKSVLPKPSLFQPDTAGIRGPDTLVAYADPKPAVDPLTAEKMAQQPQFIEPIVHCKKIQPQSTEEAPPAQVARYGGRPIIYKKPVLPGVSDQLPRYMPFTDQESLMKLLAEMPTEFRFDEFHKRVLHCVKAVNAAMHGTVTKKAELQVVQECNTFLLALPKNVFEVDGVFQTVKRLGSVVVDPKSIPNPDYVSPAAKPAETLSTPKEDKGQESLPSQAPPPPGCHRTTLFEVYDKMDEYFTFETLRSRASEHGHDRPKVSAFVSLMCKIGSLRHIGGFLYEKLSSVTSPEMRHLASLIA